MSTSCIFLYSYMFWIHLWTVFAEYIIHGAVPWNVKYVWCSLNTLRTEKMAGILRMTFNKNAVFSETSSFHISLTEQLLDFIVLNFGNKWINNFVHSFLWNEFNYSSSSTLHIFLYFNECWCYIAKAIIVHNVNMYMHLLYDASSHIDWPMAFCKTVVSPVH